MKELHVTQKRYNQLCGVRGGLVIVAIRIFAGAITSFINAFLVHSYLNWGFEFPWFFPFVYTGLGILYILDAFLLFKRKQAFILIYLAAALVFVLTSAVMGGYGFVVYAAMEILVIIYLFRSKRAAITFEIKKTWIIDAENQENFLGNKLKVQK